MNRKILQPGQSYTFSQYFQMSYAIDDILKELGYDYINEKLGLPISPKLPENFNELSRLIDRNLQLTRLTTEDARKQALIAPILFEVCDYCHTRINIEYPIIANEQLKGTLDYYIEVDGHFMLVVEAKNADLTRGFTQLATEMIALDLISDDSSIIYGVVTVGNIWKFGFIDRKKHVIYEDVNFYVIPDELENLVQSLIGVLLNE